ncbi:MAG: tetratricopeptide repeat protein [Acidobacteriota bacterium]
MGRSLYSQGEEYYEQGNYSRALNLFRQALRDDANNQWDVMNYMGGCEIGLAHYVEALDIFNQIILLNPDWERPVFNKGRVFMNMGMFQEALACFEKAIVINPENDNAFFYLALFYDKIQDYLNSEKYYKHAIRLNPNDATYHTNLGMIYFHTDRLDIALDEFNIAYQLDPEPFVLHNKGRVLYKQQRYEEALDCILEIHKSEPNDVDIMFDIAYIFYKLARYKKALKWITKTLDRDPSHNMARKLGKELKQKLDRNRLILVKPSITIDRRGELHAEHESA